MQDFGQLELAREIAHRLQDRLLLLGPALFCFEEARLLDRERGLRREHRELPEVGLAELSRGIGVDTSDHPHEPRSDEERRGHHGLDLRALVLVRSAFPVLVMRDDERLVRLGHETHGAFAQRLPGAPSIRRHVVAGCDDELLLVLFVDRELPGVDPEQHGRPPEHGVEELGELELRGEVGQRVDQGLLLLGPLALGAVEPRVLDRDRGLGGEQIEEPEVRLAELAGRIGVDARDGPHEPRSDHERGHHDGLHGVVHVLRRTPLPGLVVGDDQRLVRNAGMSHRPLAEAHPGTHGVGPHVVAGEDDQLLGLLVVDRELAAGNAEERHGALEDDLEQPPQLELAGEVLERVEERALLGRARPLGLDQPRARDRDRRLARGGRGDLHVPLLEGARPVPLDDQLPDGALPDAERQLEFGHRRAAVGAERPGARLEPRIEGG